MDAETLLLETEESMLKAVDFAKQEFSGVRTGKASPGLVENLDVHVSSYGSVMKLKGLAVISTPEPRLILIQPFDPSTVHDIGRAINESKLNLNPLVEGRSIRLPIPALTEDHDHLTHPQPFYDNDRQRNQLPRLRHRNQGNHPFPE